MLHPVNLKFGTAVIPFRGFFATVLLAAAFCLGSVPVGAEATPTTGLARTLPAAAAAAPRTAGTRAAAAPRAAAREAAVPRLKSDSLADILKVRNSIVRDKGFSVVFIGDSVLYSSTSKSDRDTIPSTFSRLIRKELPHRNINVYDLSLPGCALSESYEVLRYILDANPDMVIIDLNIGWFGSNKPGHPVLKNLNARSKNPNWKPLQVPAFAADLYKPWYEKDFSSLTKVKGKLGYYMANRSNPQWAAFLDMITLLKNRNRDAVFFIPPRNRALYDKYNLVDDQALQEKISELRSLTDYPGLRLFDYSWEINSRIFSDSVHMLPAGNKELARLIADDIVRQSLIR